MRARRAEPDPVDMLSDRYKEAMVFAAKLHDRHYRKGTEIAYLSHLLSVSALVMENGGTEEEAIGALLHDAIEDQGDDYQSEYLSEPLTGREALKRDIGLKYGDDVLRIVLGCTDDEDFVRPPAGELGTVEEWKVRKSAFLEHIEDTLDGAVLRVACADKLHNARTMLLEYQEEGEAFWGRFRARTKRNQLWYYGSLGRAFEKKGEQLGDRGIHGMASELKHIIQRIGALDPTG